MNIEKLQLKLNNFVLLGKSNEEGTKDLQETINEILSLLENLNVRIKKLEEAK